MTGGARTPSTEPSTAVADRRSPPGGASGARARAWGAVLVAALVMTLATALKPLVVDDAALYPYAEQMARAPLDPYGFEVFWYHQPEPANQVLTPPVLPYWWSLAIRLFGERPILWKLWLFPVHLLLALSVLSLARRFAPGREVPLLFLVALSPAILPAIDLMLDVPALALGATAVVLALKADERDSLALMLLAGAVAGLAMQTKYNALASLLACLAWLALRRRWRRAFHLGLAATAVFLAWEVFTYAKYGDSHFLYALLEQENAKDDEKPLGLWLLGLLSLVGGLFPALGILSLASRGAGRRIVGIACALPVLAYAALPFLPPAPVADQGSSVPDLSAPRPELLVFLPLGVLVVAALAAGLVPLLRGGRGVESRFLVLWAACELVVLFALSPFLAGRRLVGLGLPLALGLGRLGVVRRTPLATTRLAAGLGVLLGLLYAWTDVTDARTRSRAPELTLRRIEQLGGDPARETVWFLGHWGFQFHAQRAGMKLFVPGHTRVEKGDWLVYAEGVDTPRYSLPESAVNRLAWVAVQNPWPWSTLPSFFTGPIPMRRQPENQLATHVLRFTGNFKAPMPRARGPEVLPSSRTREDGS